MLAVESLAQTRHERDGSAQQAAELKTILESAESNARAMVDEAARAAREGAEQREKAVVQRLHAVANSLLGTCCFLLLKYGRVFVFAEASRSSSFCAGYLGTSASSSVQASPEDLEGALADLEGASDQTSGLLLKAKDVLTCLHSSVLPKCQPRASLGELAELFGPEASTIGDFRREQTVRGSQTTLLMLLGHGFEGDFDKAVSGVPADRTAKCCRLAISLLGPASLRRSLRRLWRGRPPSVRRSRRKLPARSS